MKVSDIKAIEAMRHRLRMEVVNAELYKRNDFIQQKAPVGAKWKKRNCVLCGKRFESRHEMCQDCREAHD